MGYNRGYDIASKQKLPEIGDDAGDYSFGFIPDNPIKTIEDAYDVFIQVCYETDSNDRNTSSFQSTEAELETINNNDSITFDPWEEFEKGLEDGIDNNWNERKKFYKLN